MSTYLVTGATGFLGQHLCRQLKDAGHAIRAIVRQEHGDLAEIGAEQVRGDVLDAPSSLAAAMKGVDGVFHLAGRVSRNPEDGPALHKLHVMGTENIVAACREAGVKRLVHCSTSGTVGVTPPPGEELDESATPDLALVGRWPYYLSKLFAEQAALRANSSSLEVVSINPSLLLGPGDERGESVRDVKLFLERKVPGYPLGGMSIVDVRDAARALVLGMEKGRAGERYLVTALNLSVKDFFERLAAVSGVPAPALPMPAQVGVLSARMLDGVARLLDGNNPLDAMSVEMAGHCWFVSARKAQRDLGIQFRDVGQTLHDTVEDLRRRGVREADVLPQGGGLVESVAADAWRALDRWAKRASSRP